MLASYIPARALSSRPSRRCCSRHRHPCQLPPGAQFNGIYFDLSLQYMTLWVQFEFPLGGEDIVVTMFRDWKQAKAIIQAEVSAG